MEIFFWIILGKKNQNTFRILVLGDSSTFGLTVNSFSKLYHSLLEEKLNKDFNQNINYEVINGGVPGYTSYQGLNIYKYKFAKYEPDIVTFYFGINDIAAHFHLNDKQIMSARANTSDTIKKIKNYFLEKSAFYRLLTKIVLNINIKTYKKVRRVSLEDFGKNIIEMNELSKKNGTMLLLISPLMNNDRFLKKEIRYEYPYRSILESTAKQYNILLLSIDRLTERSNIPNKIFFNDDVHLNEQGHVILMEALLYYLKKYTNLGQGQLVH